MNPNRDEYVGVSVALLCGIVLGSAVAVSRFAYDGGASGIAVAIGRSSLMVVVLLIGIKVAAHSLRLPRKLLPLTIGNGILMALMTYGNIGAVEYISIGLASLLFFTFPLVIAVLVVVLRLERLTLAKLSAIVLAFIGLSIMLGSAVGNVDGRGTAFSLVASLATAINAILVGRYFRAVNVFVMALHFSAVALVFLLALAASVAEVRLPQTFGGWGGILGVAGFQAIGTPLYFFAIKKVGALKTGMAGNIQPVTSIFEAWVLFDEVLGALQACGGAIVLLAIGFMQWVDLRVRKNVIDKAKLKAS